LASLFTAVTVKGSPYEHVIWSFDSRLPICSTIKNSFKTKNSYLLQKKNLKRNAFLQMARHHHLLLGKGKKKRNLTGPLLLMEQIRGN
jgi:hypothetical protein